MIVVDFARTDPVKDALHALVRTVTLGSDSKDSGYQRAARERLRAVWEALSAKRDNDSFSSTIDKSSSTDATLRRRHALPTQP